MTTFRELEAFVAVADQGSFEKAAQCLATSQSNISRHINGFEDSFDKPLFDRTSRSARLTMEGQEVLRLARDILRRRSDLAERFGNAELLSSTLRVGVTELSALTWLGRFLVELRQCYPKMRVEPVVASSAALHAQLRLGQLDIVVVLSAVNTSDMARLPIGTAEFGWYCSTALDLPEVLTMPEFERQSVLLQGELNEGGSVLERWLRERDVRTNNTVYCDSLMALASICAAGLGVAGLPHAVAQGAVRNGSLRRIEIPIGAPAMEYIALVRIDSISDFHRNVVSIARANCDLQTPFDGM